MNVSDNGLQSARLTDESARLVRANVDLSDETTRLREQSAELLNQLAVVTRENKVGRERRLAALNLLEDAVQARLAAQRETADRQRAEEELRASEEKYRSLFESIDVGFFILEKVDAGQGAVDFQFVEVNPAFVSQTGIAPSIGASLSQTFSEQSQEWISNCDQVLSTGGSNRFEQTCISQNRVLEIHAYRLPDESNRRVAVLCKDISDRRAAEEARREADRRKDEFLAMLAHELRNPMAPVRNSVHFLRLTCNHDPTVERVCAMMERQINHMVRLVDDLMDMSRITRGLFELQKQNTDLETVLNVALETSRPLIDASQHQLETTLPQDRIPLHGDVVRLSQVFANLLNNAAKYTDHGGQIWLQAERIGQEAVVSVRDSGIGIPKTLQSVVFEMFAQADRSSTKSQGGLGIGLTLARRLVEMHGGTIKVHSDGSGKGSEFIVRLPVAAACEVSKSSSQQAVSIIQRRVLVVDDNVDAAGSLGILLSSLGSDVKVAHDGPAAIEIIKHDHPDVVFLDIGMPGMDGYEVARRIRTHMSLEKPMLVALTGWGQEEDRIRARQAGFDHHLVKPADIDSLQTLLSSGTSPPPVTKGRQPADARST